MTNEYVRVPRDGAGKKIRTTIATVDGEEVHQEVVQVVNATDEIINVSTEDKQDNIITELQLKADLTETQPVQLQTGTNTAGKFVITNGGGDAETHSSCLYTMDYVVAVAHGLLPGYATRFAVGKKSAIGIGAFTILEVQDFVQPPSSPGDIQMYVQSTSAQDSAGGTGITEMTMEYFSLAWGIRKTVTFVPDGTNQVVIPGGVDKYRIHTVKGTNGHPAVGTITITNQAGSILYGSIEQYRTYMERCIFYIAENETVVVTQAILGSTTSGGVNVVCFVTEESASGNTITRGRRTVEIANNSDTFNFNPYVVISNPNNKRKSVGLSVNGNLANQKCTATLCGFLEAD